MKVVITCRLFLLTAATILLSFESLVSQRVLLHVMKCLVVLFGVVLCLLGVVETSYTETVTD